MMKRLRIISQIFFLIFFLFLFFQAKFPYDNMVHSELYLQASPLVMLITMIAARVFISAAFIAIIILILTIPLGRFFCGWICPLGFFIDGFDHLIPEKSRAAKFQTRKNLLWIKYFLLIIILTGAVFSVQFVWIFDPLVILTRTFVLTLYPLFVFILNSIFNFLFKIGLFEDQTLMVYDFLQNTVLPVQQPAFYFNVFVLLIFILILSGSFLAKRFWCRNICPLGALLALFSRYRVFNRFVTLECSSCGKCKSVCKMNAIEDDYSVSDKAECIECGNCVSVCVPGADSFKFGKKVKKELDFSRRRVLLAGAAGIAGLGLMQTGRKFPDASGSVIRPPGAVPEDQFLDRCIRCQECVRICATTGGCLQPAFLESGLEGFWSPVSVPAAGYCEYSCNLCGQVCPTGAIQKLSIAKKKKLKMGLAFFDKNKCIPWYSFNDCLVCEEHCPVEDKAIKFDIKQVITPDGAVKIVKFPYIVEDRCTGCGICENKCPVIGSKGIFITSAENERVHPQKN